MKYYVFLLGLVLVMSFQNCGQSNFSETSGNTLIESLVDGTGSTDTGNGGDYEANAFIQDIANFTFILCTKNEEMTGTETYNCVNQLSDVAYYNKISEGIEFDSMSHYLQLADARAIMLNATSMNECKNYIYALSDANLPSDTGFIDEVLNFSACNSIIIPVPGFVY